MATTAFANAVCGGKDTSRLKEPKFVKGQKVTYAVPKFYSLVCTGRGKISRYEPYSDSYTVEETLGNGDCPDIDGLKEKDIQAIK